MGKKFKVRVTNEFVVSGTVEAETEDEARDIFLGHMNGESEAAVVPDYDEFDGAEVWSIEEAVDA